MEMAIREEGPVRILVLEGRLDAAVAAQVKERIQELLDEGNQHLVLDLGGVTFLDSSGLGALVSCLRRVKEKKGEIKLAALRPEVRSIFDITRVSRLFQICEEVSEAVKAFGKDA